MNKIKLERNKNYTTISNVISKDKRVGLAERGLFLTIMSLPDNWNLTISGLEEILLESKDKISKTINNLIRLGYCERVQVKNKNNHFKGYDYTFYESPKNIENPNPIFPKTENPYPENPDTENPQQLSKQELNTNKEINIYSEKENLTDTDKQLNAFNNILNTNPEIKKEFEELPKPLNIDREYYKLFIQKWNEYVLKFTDRKTGISELTPNEKSQLKSINRPIKEISEGLFILFSQNDKETYPQCWTRPTHFLKQEQFLKYYEDAQNFKITKKITQFHKTKN
jgi:hypothetical protein